MTSLAEQIRLACLLEVTARKAGNVHPWSQSTDACHADFVRAANVSAPILSAARQCGVGRAIRDAAVAVRGELAANVNLGILLLLGPLAAVGRATKLREGIDDVLNGLTQCDAVLVYEAIRIMQPGGLSRVDEQDVSQTPSASLVECMRLAAGRDNVARQYVTGFELVLSDGVTALVSIGDFQSDWERAVIRLQLQVLSRYPDSLIARKCGPHVAQHASELAAGVLAAGWPDQTRAQQLMSRFDHWLRADGNRRNPGTTADLVAASLFAAIRDECIVPPSIKCVERFAQESGETA